MGFRLAVLAYFDTPALDPSQQIESPDLRASIVKDLFPRTRYAEHDTATLLDSGFPEQGEVAIATLVGGVVIATRDAHLYNPSKLHRRYLKIATHRNVVLLTQRSFYDMFAYARWVNGVLIRSISVNPIGKVWESLGTPELFEKPFWDGQHRVSAEPGEDDYPLPSPA